MSTDIVSDRLIAEFAATLGPWLWTPPEGEAPLGLHWCLFPPTADTADLGPDGHPPRQHLVSTTDFPRRMWVGGMLGFDAPLRPGQRITRTTTLKPLQPKSGTTGELVFSGAKHRFEADGELLLTEDQDIVFRTAAYNPVSATQRAANTDSATQPAANTDPMFRSNRSWVVPTPPTLLFRYSALTFNSHRIHYDHPYATGVEGYAGLVVHGPLQATVLLNLTAKLLGRAPTYFGYKAIAPLTGSHMIASGRLKADGSAMVSMFAPDGTQTMRVRAG